MSRADVTRSERPRTAHEVWRWAGGILHGYGVAARNSLSVRAREHLLTEGNRMLCTGGHRTVRGSNPLGPRCPSCMAEARRMLNELWEDDRG
jgi:hypothetical protein